jgi:hypothetical protein
LATARVDGALACPASVDVNSAAVYDDAYECLSSGDLPSF